MPPTSLTFGQNLERSCSPSTVDYRITSRVITITTIASHRHCIGSLSHFRYPIRRIKARNRGTAHLHSPTAASPKLTITVTSLQRTTLAHYYCIDRSHFISNERKSQPHQSAQRSTTDLLSDFFLLLNLCLSTLQSQKSIVCYNHIAAASPPHHVRKAAALVSRGKKQALAFTSHQRLPLSSQDHIAVPSHLICSARLRNAAPVTCHNPHQHPIFSQSADFWLDTCSNIGPFPIPPAWSSALHSTRIHPCHSIGPSFPFRHRSSEIERVLFHDPSSNSHPTLRSQRILKSVLAVCIPIPSTLILPDESQASRTCFVLRHQCRSGNFAIPFPCLSQRLGNLHRDEGTDPKGARARETLSPEQQ